jgi:hypothetical protein
MGILKNILPVGTQLAATSTSGTGLELIYIQAKYKMALNMTDAIPIAVNMSSGQQERSNEAQRAYSGIIPIEVGYYSRWDDRNDTIDAIWDGLDVDIERMAANVESNDDTEYGGTNHTISLEKIAFSSYEDQKDETFVGLTLIKRVMTLTYNVLPYGT